MPDDRASRIADDLRDRKDDSDTRKPHNQPAVLRCIRHKHELSCRDAAEAIEEAFGYTVSASTISRAVNRHDIRDPADSVFADLFCEGGVTEVGQPSATPNRSTETPVHPLDTDCFNGPEAGGGSWDGTLPTPHFPSPVDTQSNGLRPKTTDSDSVHATDHDITPSDWRVTMEHRDASLVAPPYAARSDDFPNRYRACGCGRCSDRHYLDGDDGGAPDCPQPVPVTVAGARKIYQHCEGTNVTDDVIGNDVERARQKYAKLMKADSGVFRVTGPDPFGDDGMSFDGAPRTDHITTVLVSLRVSPTVEVSGGRKRLVTPYTLIQDVKDAWGESRDEIPRVCGEGPLSYFWMLSGTDKWATPHVHCYIWYHDRDDGVASEDFAPMVTQFVDSSAYVATDDHIRVGADSVGTADGQTAHEYDPSEVTLVDGVVRVETDPLLADPERLSANTEGTDAFADVLDDPLGADRLTDGDVQSRGAIYVGSQLPEWALCGAESDADTEFAAFTEVAADGRNLSHGGALFYKFPDVVDKLRDTTEEELRDTTA